VQRLTHAEINERFRDFKRFTHFEEIPFERVARLASPDDGSGATIAVEEPTALN